MKHILAINTNIKYAIIKMTMYWTAIKYFFDDDEYEVKHLGIFSKKEYAIEKVMECINKNKNFDNSSDKATKKLVQEKLRDNLEKKGECQHDFNYKIECFEIDKDKTSSVTKIIDDSNNKPTGNISNNNSPDDSELIFAMFEINCNLGSDMNGKYFIQINGNEDQIEKFKKNNKDGGYIKFNEKEYTWSELQNLTEKKNKRFV